MPLSRGAKAGLALLGLGLGAAAAIGIAKGTTSPPPMPRVIFGIPLGADADLLSAAIRPLVRPGDVLDLYNGQRETPANPAELLQQAEALLAGFPGLSLPVTAHTSGLTNVETFATANLPRSVDGIAYDYEPNFESEFTFDFPTTLGHFSQFAEICTRTLPPLTPVGYPTGRMLTSSDRWDYAALAAEVKELWVQTQAHAKAGMDAWQAAIDNLVNDFAARGQPLGKLTVQFTFGSGEPNGTTATAAEPMWTYANGRGIEQVYLFWTTGDTADLAQFLAFLGR
jgi:hypothetical protein